MRAQEQTVWSIIGGLDKCFIIPPFQRNYEWTFEQCDELFYDIVNAFETGKTHYLGNVVYYVGKNNGASYNEFILVDGQQRITTILLLLCAIRDLTDDENIEKSINTRYLKNDSGSEQFRIRLKQTSYDSKSFIAVIDRNIDNASSDSNIVKNYNHFKDLLKECTISLKDIYETIPKLEVVDVNLQIENDLNAVQTVFEKINSTGKQLSSADLIRNYLLISDSSQEQEKLYQDYWVKIEQTVKNDNISRFARDYLIMNIFEDVPEGNIYKMFKNHYNETQATHIDILSELKKYSDYFAWLKFENSPNNSVNRIITFLNFLRTDDLYPLYLYLFDNLYNSNIIELKRILELFIDFMLRYRIVAPSGGGGALRSVVHQLLEKLNSEEIELKYDSILFELSNSSAISGRFPSDEEFKEALMKSVNVNYARSLLVRMEEIETKNISVPLREITTEHLMPQKLTDWWINNLGGKDEAERIYDRYLNCIGNLTPMSAGYNSSNSNKKWDDKLVHIKNVQFAITSEIASFDKWTEEEIKKRNEEISNRACATITAPLVRTRKYQTKNASEEFVPGLYPVSDVTTPMSNTNVTEILFENTVIKVSSWKEFFKTICEIAYDFDSLLFRTISDSNQIHKATSNRNYPEKDPIITDNKDLLVGPRAVSDSSIYIEGCLSSSRARIYAKQLLDIYGITDDFQINVE